MSPDQAPTKSEAPPALPQYGFGTVYALKVGLSLLLRRHRDMARDAEALFSKWPDRWRVLDAEHVPSQGPFVIVANHYEREGLWNVWCALLASWMVARQRRTPTPVHWLMANDWPGLKLLGIPIPGKVIYWLYTRVAHCYKLIVLPIHGDFISQRAAAMRHALRAVLGEGALPHGSRKRPSGVVGVFPEGDVSQALIEARPGSGSFLERLVRHPHLMVPLLPIGFYEKAGVLTIRFGPPFYLDDLERLSKAERDQEVRDRVMVAIGKLLPEELWGYYAEKIQRAPSSGSPPGPDSRGFPSEPVVRPAP